MRVTRLNLTNLRAIEVAEFRFEPGFNLIVGVNGVGKSSVLDALGVALSAIIKRANGLRSKSGAFLDSDIRKGARALTAECKVAIGEREYDYLIHKARSSGEGQAAKAGAPREQALDTPDKAEFVGATPSPSTALQVSGRPFGVFFSTQRAVTSTVKPSKGSAAGGMAGACADAFAHRELRLSEIAAWMQSRDKLRKESPADGRLLEALDSMTRQFLPEYQNLRSSDDSPLRLLIDRGTLTTIQVDELLDSESAGLKEAIQWAESWMSLNWSPNPNVTDSELQHDHAAKKASKIAEGLEKFLPNCENLRPVDAALGNQVIDRKPTTIEVSQLSDGERGTLALVLDLTRRLALANPEMRNPATEAEAVVLIDEIDLHLHPKWQRQIVRNLTAAFPRCQFIATTHSPQIIGEVEHGRIQIIANHIVYSPTHSFGVDSSRVLEEIMEARPRTEIVDDLLSQISKEIGEERYNDARDSLAKLEDHLEEDDPEVTRIRTLLEFMEDNE